jgi:hypothetical protein
MERREFMKGATAVAAVAATLGRGRAATTQDKRSRIAIMMFGFNRLVKTNQPPAPDRTIELMEVGELCADRFHVHNVEIQSTYFPSTEMSYLRDFKARMAKTKTRVSQINLEFNNPILQLTSDTAVGRLAMFDLHRVWYDKAVFLGCPRVLINQGTPTQENKLLAISNLKQLVAIAPKGLKVSIENRPGGGGLRGAPGAPPAPGAAARGAQGGQPAQAAQAPSPAAAPRPSGPPSYILLVEILKAAGAYGCCDCGNFGNQPDELEGIKAMLPITSGSMHIGLAFDLAKSVAATREMNYQGLYSLKAGGQAGGSDPLDATQKILDGVLAGI